jgi:ribosomal protein S9
LIICNKKADLLFAIQAPLDLFQLKNHMTLVLMLWVVGCRSTDAITLAIARALCKIDQVSWLFKIKGLLTRDARVKERKKYGLKKKKLHNSKR